MNMHSQNKDNEINLEEIYKAQLGSSKVIQNLTATESKQTQMVSSAAGLTVLLQYPPALGSTDVKSVILQQKLWCNY